MAKVRIAINGFGRIGRATFRILMNNPKAEVVAINDLGDKKTLAYLLQRDTVYGTYEKPVSVVANGLRVGNKTITVLAQKDPAKLPWKKMKVDVVVESTGFFTTTEDASAHVRAGAKHVIISAPADDETTPVFVQGVNDDAYKKGRLQAKVSSNASCTTNCLTPVAEVMVRNFGVKSALMSTSHAYTATQSLVDGPQSDPRRGRAAAQNIVPTSTGAAITSTKAVPELKGFFDGISLRVPVPAGSINCAVFQLKKDTTAEEVNRIFIREAASKRYKGILGVTDEPLVSTDIIGDTHSAIVDLKLTRVVGGNLAMVVAWYDNEWGYSARLAEQAVQIGTVIAKR